MKMLIFDEVYQNARKLCNIMHLTNTNMLMKYFTFRLASSTIIPRHYVNICAQYYNDMNDRFKQKPN